MSDIDDAAAVRAQRPSFTEKFDNYACPEEYIEVRLGSNLYARATIIADHDHGEPQDEADCYGIVTGWINNSDRDEDDPDYRLLVRSHGSARYYDWKASMEKAEAEDWGCGKDDHGHKSREETRTCAVEQDFKVLYDWFNDHWFFCGIVLSLHKSEDDGDHEIDDHLASLWGIECNCLDDNSYLLVVANDLLSESWRKIVADHDLGLKRECFKDAYIRVMGGIFDPESNLYRALENECFDADNMMDREEVIERLERLASDLRDMQVIFEGDGCTDNLIANPPPDGSPTCAWCKQPHYQRVEDEIKAELDSPVGVAPIIRYGEGASR